MTKYRARVDCYLQPAVGDSAGVNSRANGEFFVNLIQHMSSSMNDLGIEMLAWNYGDGGSDWSFWDEPGATGRNAFACFRFHSASFGKFDCLIYENTGSNTSVRTHTGSIFIDNQDRQFFEQEGYYQVGIAFACHPSGSVPNTYPYVDGPWNGGYGMSASIETVGPVWKTTPAGKGAFFPRPNGVLGQLSSSRSSLSGIAGSSMDQSKNHFILSEDSVTILVDDASDGYSRVMHFGPYIPRSGSNPESPYVMWNTGDDNVAPWIHGYANTIGSFTLVSNAPQGAIAHPDLSKGALKLSWGFLAHDSSNGYNNFINSGSFEKFPVWAIVNEGTERGILGTLKHLTLGVGMNSLTVSTLSSSAAFGRPTTTESKVLVPWDGVPPQSSSPNRTGRNFSIG
jgi:hypothetical protein